MRRLLSITLMVLFAGTGIAVAGEPACACSCAFGTEAERFANHDTVFVGVVTDIGSAAGDEKSVSFRVEQVLKGGDESVITLRARSGDSAACGYEFAEGYRYRVYAQEGKTNLCSGNLQLGFVGTDGTGDTGRDDQAWVWGLAAGGGLVVAALVLLFVRQASRRGRAGAHGDQLSA